MSIEARKYRLKANLDRIVHTLIKGYSPESIILFGSMSDGTIHEWSDLDLVIIKETEKPFYERLREVATLCDSDVSVHYLVYTPQEFHRLQQDGHFFVNHEIIKKGVVLYERIWGMAQSSVRILQQFTDLLESEDNTDL
jgi:uncharacterized protein